MTPTTEIRSHLDRRIARVDEDIIRHAEAIRSDLARVIASVDDGLHVSRYGVIDRGEGGKLDRAMALREELYDIVNRLDGEARAAADVVAEDREILAKDLGVDAIAEVAAEAVQTATAEVGTRPAQFAQMEELAEDDVYAFQAIRSGEWFFVAETLDDLRAMAADGFVVGAEQCDGCGSPAYLVEPSGLHVRSVDEDFGTPDDGSIEGCGMLFSIESRDADEVVGS